MDFHLDTLLNLPNVVAESYSSTLDAIIVKLQLVNAGINCPKHSHKHRPLPESIQFTRTKFERIWAGDGSTLEAIFKKLDSLAKVPKNQLAGKIGVVIDIVTRLPVEIWFQENAKASDMKFESDILKLVLSGLNMVTI